MSTGAVYLHIDRFDMYGKLDFDKKQIRKAMRFAGKEVQTAAKQLVGLKRTSTKGQYPGRKTGTLQRSIKPKVSRSGFLVVIKPYKTAKMKHFYPAYLANGVRRGAVRGRSHRRGASGGSGWRIAPRKNYMEEALNQKRGRVQAIITKYFREAVK